MKRSTAFVAMGAIIVALALAMSLYTVDQRKAAIKFQLGEVVSVITDPGLYFMVPVLQNVRMYDTRIQTLDSRDAERFLTSENKNVLVDSFVKWRVIDVRQFYVSVRGDPIAAEARISQTVNDALRAEFAKRTVHEVVSGQRESIMSTVADKVDKDVKGIGVEVVDVRLKRVDLVPEISSDVYRRMESERKRVANELRATGQAEGEKIKAEADRQRQVIVAEAYRDAQRVKGEGDALAARIYSEAYGKNPEFYSFYRSLDAYRQTLRSKSDVMVLDPSSDFFKYLKNPGRGK
ncbi:Modulator of FtsH protease HflC [Usitatibacter rugosus]|uniref:Protein HflC n=1 Tax=Usitatibacter rugosus TaxID=2732067 RepID=A0A6M4GWU8_9PROT|nr:protease modulator HflC [Usitatibacter rugosus]QJR11739.1 Modulator of FtsH protease HflC [Usitatibacter rugosus]